MYRYSLYLILCCWCCTPVMAQWQNGSHISWQNTENGFPSNGIKSLAFDETTGFLWVATEGGIIRFNGTHSKHFTKTQVPQLYSERMGFIIKGRNDTLFLGDEKDQLFTIDKNTPVWNQSTSNNFFLNYRLRQALVINNLKLANQILHPQKIDTQKAFIKIVPVSDNAAILMDQFSGIHYLHEKQENYKQLILSDNSIKTIFKAGKRVMKHYNTCQFAVLDTLNGSFQPIYLKDANGKAVVNSEQNSLLIWEYGMDNPLFFQGTKAWLITDKGSHLEATLLSDIIPEDAQIKCAIYSKSHQLLIIGTDSKGLMIIKPNWVTPKKPVAKNLTNRNSVYAQIALSNGNVLTNEGDIIGEANNTGISLPIARKFGYTVYNIKDSILIYFASVPGIELSILHIYHYSTGITNKYPSIKCYEPFGAVYHEGNIFLAINDGIYKIGKDSSGYVFNPGTDLKFHEPAISISILTPETFLVASCNGLIQFNIAKHTIDTLLKFPGNCIRNITPINGYQLIGTYGKGFYMYKEGRIKQMPLDNKKFLLYAHCFVPDENGFVWISTNRGLFKASFNDLIQSFEKDIPKLYYHYYGKNDGMDITEMNGGCAPCALVMKNKIISFPTMDGILWVDPNHAQPLLQKQPIYIDEIEVNSIHFGPVQFSAQRLPPETKNILVHIGYPSWGNKENIFIEYRLHPNDQWKPQSVNQDNIIEIYNLRAGKYNLEIRKLNGFGDKNYSYATLSFSIAKPWYMQWWAFLIAMGWILTMIWLFLHLRTKQYKRKELKLQSQIAEKTKALQQKNEALEKNNAINMRLISIISHDIITPLKFVAMGGNELIHQKERMPDALKEETIAEITNTAQELQLLSTNIMNWIKYQNENRRQEKEWLHLYLVAEQVTAVLYSIAKQKNLIICNEIDKEIKIYQFLEPIKILLYNLVSNAINFSNNGTIGIHCISHDSNIVLQVADEGSGMTQDQIKNILSKDLIISSANVDNKKGNGLGYLIIKDLLKMMEGSLAISSTKGKGTKVSVTIPIKTDSEI